MKHKLVPQEGFEPSKSCGLNAVAVPICMSHRGVKNGAEEEVRTLDINLGKVVLYQLSYFRIENGALNGD